MTETKEKVLRLSKIVGKGYKDFWETRRRYRVLIGSRASKKSTTTSLWIIHNMMKFPLANTLVLRKIYKDHKDSTYTQLKWAIHQLGVDHLWTARLSPLEIIYNPTGQKILFRGLDDPMSVTSITVEVGHLCWAWFEEFFQIADETDFNMIDGSIRGAIPPPLFKQITGTMNPWNEKHWIKKRFFDVESDHVFTKQTNYKCNEFLDAADEAFFDHMRKTNPRRYHVEGLGNWGMAEGLVYTNWREELFDKDEIVKKIPGVQSAFGLDFGYTADPSGFICCLVDERGYRDEEGTLRKRIWIFDEHYQKGMLNPEIARMIEYKGYKKELIVADCAEPKSIAEIKGHGIPRIRPARKGKDSISNGIQFIQQFEVIVHPSCTNTILELNNYAFDTKDGKVINEPIDDYNHLMDAFRYAMERFLVRSNIWLLSNKSQAEAKGN